MKAEVLLAVVLLAGCASWRPDASVALPVALRMEGSSVPMGEALAWDATLLYSPVDETRCGPDNCDVKVFQVADAGPGHVLQAALDWADMHDANNADWDAQFPSFNVTLTSPSGMRFYDWGAKFGAQLRVDGPEPGTWTFEVRITHMVRDWNLHYALDPVPYDPVAVPTAGTYHAKLLFAEAPPAPAPGPLLPDLLVVDIDQLRIEYATPPSGNQYRLPSLEHPLYPGCTVDENEETGAKRCLRFSLGVGNDGAGPFLVAPKASRDFATALVDDAQEVSLPAVQCVAESGGGGEVREAGTVTYSRSHGHYHFDGILGYRLRAYDVATGTAGADVATGAKLGYGPAAEALVHAGLRLAPERTLEVPCPDMGWAVGLNAGWYDYYLWWRTSQYVDVEGVPDGTYLLEATFNPDHHILESDYGNNAAGVVLRLTGDQVEILVPYQRPP